MEEESPFDQFRTKYCSNCQRCAKCSKSKIDRSTVPNDLIYKCAFIRTLLNEVSQ